MLASNAGRVPATVREAVLGRIARLAPEARQVLDLMAVVPPRIERGLLDALLAPKPAALEACQRTGLIREQDGTLAFRHELARQVLEAELPAARLRELHSEVLQALLAPGAAAPLARLVHHARSAGDAEALERFAPQAAREAAAVGAHREAAAHYQTALQFASHSSPEARAELLDGLSYERYLIGQLVEAVSPRQEALAIWEQLGRPQRQAECWRALSQMAWYLGQGDEVQRCAAQAVRVLEAAPPVTEQAMVFSDLSRLYMSARDTAAAVAWGQRAMALAEQVGATVALVISLNNVGSVEYERGQESGRLKLERSLALALANDLQDHAARAYCNLQSVCINNHAYGRSDEYFAAGLPYMLDRDLLTRMLCLRAGHAQACLEQGRWEEAEQECGAVIRTQHGAILMRLEALTTLGTLRARRSDPGWAEALNEARDLAAPTGNLGFIAPVATARAEAAWLQGDLEGAQAEALPIYEQARRRGAGGWLLGSLAYWLGRAGALPEPPGQLPVPFALQFAGDWQAAAEAWEQMGRPYEQGLALADGDEAGQRQALAIFQHLGATAAADRLRQMMRAAGVRSLPRGPRPATQAHPLGLTARETEILRLLAERRTNAEIAAHLHISPKTVDHHVSAVLAKLDVHTREDAARLAVKYSPLPPR